MGLFSENNLPEQGVKDVHEHEHEEIKIRTHVNKICSLWLLVWDILVFLNFRFAIFLRIWFVFHSNLHFLICYKSVQNLVIVWRFLSHCLGMPFWQAHGTFTLQFQIWSWDVITYIFGHQMTQLAWVAKLATWWHHSHWFQIWPPDFANCISCKFDHQMAPLALVAKLATRWRHLHKLQIWPPDGVTWFSCKYGHQMAPLAWVANLATRWRH